MQLAWIPKNVGLGIALLNICAFLPMKPARPQAPSLPTTQTSPDTLNFEDLAAKGTDLLAKARAAEGSAAITLSTYPGHYTMLTARTRSGGGEAHQHYADFLFVLAGEGTELTGGTLQNPKELPDGEMRGTSLDGATPHPLHKGDVIHIPAGTPHQAIEAPGQTITLYVVKVREPETQSH
jgi:quercetin dioxygenase-like cupin family protein